MLSQDSEIDAGEISSGDYRRSCDSQPRLSPLAGNREVRRASFFLCLSLSSPTRGQGSLREGKRGKGNSRPSEFLPDPPGRWPGTRPIIKTRLAAATAPCFNKSVYTAPCPFRPSRGGPARARTFAACTHARATRGPRSQRGATCNYLYCRSLRFPPRPAPLLRKASRIADRDRRSAGYR